MRICRAKRSVRVRFLEEVTGVPVSIVSTGSGRNDTIIRENIGRGGVVRSRHAVTHVLMASAEGFDGLRFGILEFDARPVARHALRNLEERPRNGRR